MSLISFTHPSQPKSKTQKKTVRTSLKKIMVTSKNWFSSDF